MPKVIGGVLLISGTTVGAAILALPVATGNAGFFPSIAIFLFYWTLLTFSALLMLEATLWMEEGTNLLTMAKRTLGGWGELISWSLYLFLLYALTTAYLAGGGAVCNDFIQTLTGRSLPKGLEALPMILLFGFFVYRGARTVDLANRLLMAGLFITYALMALYLVPYVEPELLMRAEWGEFFLCNSVVATAFGFHIIIPSLATYLKRDAKSLVKAILIGSAIPLFLYLVWELLALGIIPLGGEQGLAAGYLQDKNAVHLITRMLGGSLFLGTVARFFAFFTIVTSFLGVSLSLRDFLADGLNISQGERGRKRLSLLTFIPPLLFIWINPNAFFLALEYAGAFGVMILLGLIPALMVWQGRYVLEYSSSTFKAPGGKMALLLVIFFTLLSVTLEIICKWA